MRRPLTILDQNIEALLDEQVGIENDEAVGQRQDVVAGSHSEEIADSFLKTQAPSQQLCPLSVDAPRRTESTAKQASNSYQTLPLLLVKRARAR